MPHIEEMVRTHPHGPQVGFDSLAECIAACFDCAQACASCADACLNEGHVGQLVRCIRLNNDCADVCQATARLLSRQGEADMALSRRLVEACQLACRSCADECDRHAEMHEHCRICAEACRSCESSCATVLEEMTGPVA